MGKTYTRWIYIVFLYQKYKISYSKTIHINENPRRDSDYLKF